ncbi:hypothetical protein PAPYR_474 [Paratrimastix pyriformis]|uniref:Uncharacterized protein n=1 Tax=Paratrimastix pyriformis TaxID=342808 RepID=A0ABQ8UTQ0_9EUKA|nr:hypothetical protein PAPYR_474 [Paratrimastix pyriformis]
MSGCPVALAELLGAVADLCTGDDTLARTALSRDGVAAALVAPEHPTETRCVFTRTQAKNVTRAVHVPMGWA